MKTDLWFNLNYLRRAYTNARTMSDDPSTQNGAVLVPRHNRATDYVYGANMLPRGIKIPKKVIAAWTKEQKRRWMCHAERVVIHKAALRGIPTEGATLYCPWFACMDCARAIIESGITRVIGHEQMRRKIHPAWIEEIEEAGVMLDRAGVRREYLDADLFDSDPHEAVLFRGKLWIP